MTFFYDLNKKLDSIRAMPEVTHQQLNERSMSRAAKGYEKYGKPGMTALSQAGQEGASEKTMDKIRDQYDKYDNKQVDEVVRAGTLNPDGRGGTVLGRPNNQGSRDSLAKDIKYVRAHPLSPKGVGTSGATRDSIYTAKQVDHAGDWKANPKARDGKGIGPSMVGSANPYEESIGEGSTGVMDTVKSVGKKVAGGINKLVGHGSDEEMRRDLQRKSGAAVTGKKPNFADKIASAKKEVDEMLGDVAAEAMRSALSPKQKKIDMNKNGKLDANDFAMLRQGAKREMDEERSKGTAFDTSAPKNDTPRVGSVERGAKHDIKHTATGRMVTRRTDDKGISVGADDDSKASGEPRGRGRPTGTKNVSSKAKGPSGKSKLMTREGDVDVTDQGEYDQEGDMAKDDIKTIVRHAEALHKILGDNDNLPEWVQSKLAKIEGMMISIDEYMQNQEGDDSQEEPIAEKAVSKQQQKFMGMARAMQKGEKVKGASKELKKTAGTMKPGDTHDFAATKHKGLPEKVKGKKKQEKEVDESSTTAGAVSTSTAAPKGTGGMKFGGGIYDSMNRELENMIAESMSINMSDSTEGSKSLSITATDEDALKLGMMLKAAGLGGGDAHGGNMHSHSEEPCETCGSMDCGCGDVHAEVDEAAPDYPTNTMTSHDAMQYAGGLNKPKTDVAGDGQTTVPNSAVHTQEEDALLRMMEMAGLAEGPMPMVKKDGKMVPAFAADGKGKNDLETKDKDTEEDTVEESIRRMMEIAGVKKKSMGETQDERKDFFHNPDVPDDQQLPAPPEQVDVKLGDKIPGTNAIKKKDIDESIFALANQWNAYKG